MPDFLDLPKRHQKPRKAGLTHMLDKGLGERAILDLLETAGQHIDIVKFGWGTGYVTQDLKRKIELYHDAGIPVYCGGSLFEVALYQNKVSEYCRWLHSLDIDTLEVSNGMTHIPPEVKYKWIRDLSQDFTVFSEVGSKDDLVHFPPETWAEWVERELEAGAVYVLAEGREGGTAGIFDNSGKLHEDVIDMIASRVPVDKIIFESPNRPSQVWFIKKFGPNVNLGNIYPVEVIGLETLRVGLRSDTFLDVPSQPTLERS